MPDKPYNWANDDVFPGSVTTVTSWPEKVPGSPASADSWGSGRGLDPFLGGASEEEAPDLHEENVNTESKVHTSDSPTFSENGNPQEEGESGQDHGPEGSRENVRKTLGARLSLTKEKISKVRDKAAEKTTPVRRRAADAREEVDPRNFTSRRWGFLWATTASWLVGPQFVVAVWDRAVSLCGQEIMMSGPRAMGFGFLHGPGRWFRDQVALHWETGTMGHLIACAAFGIIPLVLMAASNTWSQYARWFLGAAILGPCVYVIGVSYAGWVMTWTDFYLVTLFGSAWYCTVRLREMEPGFRRFMMTIPLASVVSGALLYSPGAVW